MTKATNTNKTVVKATKAAAAPAAKATTKVEVIKTPAAETKADKARAILGNIYGAKEALPARKDIIATLVAEAKLTPAGAATYLQNYKRDHGLVKATAAPATA